MGEVKADDYLMTQDEVAGRCRVKHKTISNWVAGANPDFPKGFKLGKSAKAPRFWRRSVIEAFIVSREQDAA